MEEAKTPLEETVLVIQGYTSEFYAKRDEETVFMGTPDIESLEELIKYLVSKNIVFTKHEEKHPEGTYYGIKLACDTPEITAGNPRKLREIIGKKTQLTILR